MKAQQKQNTRSVMIDTDYTLSQDCSARGQMSNCVAVLSSFYSVKNSTDKAI